MQVQVTKPNRQVVLWEQDPAHKEANPDWPDGEIYLVGYPDEDNIYTVGDTPGVRGKIASGELVEVRSTPTSSKKTKAAESAPPETAGTP